MLKIALYLQACKSFIALATVAVSQSYQITSIQRKFCYTDPPSKEKQTVTIILVFGKSRLKLIHILAFLGANFFKVSRSMNY